MNRTFGSLRSFWWITVPVFTLFVALNYLPALQGKIPFPRDLVLGHTVWEGARPETARSFAAIIDVPAVFYPFRALLSRAAHEGTLALWNPYILGGSPFLANAQSALFYPLNLFYYILPVPFAWMIVLAIRMLLAGLFMALFARVIGVTTTGCIVAGMIFSACGFMTAWQGQAIADGAIWLPMICYAVFNLHRRPSWSSAALAAVSFAMPVLAGHPETAFQLTVTGTVLALALWAFPWDASVRRINWRFVSTFAAAGLLALGLASVQMLPTLEWLPELKQNLSLPEAALSRHDAQGFFSRDTLRDPNSAFIPIPEGASYLGMLALLISPLALLHGSRRQAIFLALLTIFALAIAFSVQPMRWIVVHLPLIKAMKNARFILIASFGIAAMAGLGVSVLEEKKQIRAAWVLFGGALVVGLFGIFEVHRATAQAPSFMRGPGGSLVFLVAAALLVGAQLRGLLPRPSFSFLICAITAADLISFSYGFLGFASAKEVFPPAPAFDFLSRQGEGWTFRIAKAGYPIPANSGMMYGIQMGEGYDICMERTRLFSRGLTEMRDDGVFFLSDKIVETKDRRLDMLNVKYLLVITPSPDFDRLRGQPERFTPVYRENSIAIFENKSVLPRAFAVPQRGAEVIADAGAQLERVSSPEFDPLQSVVIAEPLPAAEPGGTPFSSNVQISEFHNNSFVLQTQTSEPSVLVVSQIYYPGWQATVDGTETPVLPVDFGLSGINLPSGAHQVHFTFAPRSFRIGALVSLLSLVVVAGLVRMGRAPTTR